MCVCVCVCAKKKKKKKIFRGCICLYMNNKLTLNVSGFFKTIFRVMLIYDVSSKKLFSNEKDEMKKNEKVNSILFQNLNDKFNV